MRVYMVFITWDCHAEVWCALSEEIPLALEHGSFDELIERVKLAAPGILKLNEMEPAGMFHFAAEKRVGVI